ncbi:MAG TPA: DUF222 domain-containing protein, partial [Amycolatopsis sp.]|nr:DUF222 domain-containing protein [Amycolatopsis sp.]
RAEDATVQGGERAVLFVTTTVAEMEAGLRDTVLDIPGLHDVADLRRLACEARVVPAIFGQHGEPLYLGRESRLATRGQRRALALRDGGCSAPGCTRAPKWTSVHHVRWWSRGGTTDIDNLTLVCASHHRAIHQAGWQVTIRNQQAWWTLPTWLDPEQTPRRNTAHTTGPPHHHLHHTDTPHHHNRPDTADHADTTDVPEGTQTPDHHDATGTPHRTNTPDRTEPPDSHHLVPDPATPPTTSPPTTALPPRTSAIDHADHHNTT